SGSEVLSAVRQHRPDVAVLDMVMPDMDGLAVMAEINEVSPETKVLFLTANATDTHILGLIEQGARGLLLKDGDISELAPCIRTVAGGGRHLPVDLVTEAVERETGRRAVREQFTGVLSVRERRVLLLVAEGLPNKEVARRLNLAEGTVRIHMHNIYQKT